MSSKVCIHPWRFRADPFCMLGNLYYVGTRAVSSHLIDTGDGLILIDAGFPQTLYLLLESVRELGFDPLDIRYILCTHAHYDHVGGVRALAELTGAEVCLGEADVALVTSRPELTEADLYGMTFHERFDVQRLLHDGDVVALGDTAVRCLHTPGHTPGTMSFVFDVRDAGRSCRAGLHGGPGLATLMDAFLARHELPAELRAAYLQSLERLGAEHVDVHLGAHPGQNATFDKQQALADDPLAFVDPEAWPAYLEKLAQGFRRKFGGGGGELNLQ